MAERRKRGLRDKLTEAFRRGVGAELEALWPRAGSDAVDFESLETEARRLALRIMGQAVAARLNADHSDARGCRLPCGCGSEARYAGRRPKTFNNALGQLELERAWYHCEACDASFAPRDRALGLAGSSLSPAALRMTGLAAARVSFAEGESAAARTLYLGMTAPACRCARPRLRAAAAISPTAPPRSRWSAPGITATTAVAASVRATGRSGWGGTALSPAVVAARVSFGESAELLRELARLDLDAKSEERHAAALGRAIAADERRVVEPEPATARTLYLDLDGTGVPVRKTETRGRRGSNPTAPPRRARPRSWPSGRPNHAIATAARCAVPAPPPTAPPSRPSPAATPTPRRGSGTGPTSTPPAPSDYRYLARQGTSVRGRQAHLRRRHRSR